MGKWWDMLIVEQLPQGQKIKCKKRQQKIQKITEKKRSLQDNGTDLKKETFRFKLRSKYTFWKGELRKLRTLVPTRRPTYRHGSPTADRYDCRPQVRVGPLPLWALNWRRPAVGPGRLGSQMKSCPLLSPLLKTTEVRSAPGWKEERTARVEKTQSGNRTNWTLHQWFPNLFGPGFRPQYLAAIAHNTEQHCGFGSVSPPEQSHVIYPHSRNHCPNPCRKHTTWTFTCYCRHQSDGSRPATCTHRNKNWRSHQKLVTWPRCRTNLTDTSGCERQPSKKRLHWAFVCFVKDVYFKGGLIAEPWMLC